MKKLLLDSIVAVYGVVTTVAWIGVSAARNVCRRTKRAPESKAETPLGYRHARF